MKIVNIVNIFVFFIILIILKIIVKPYYDEYNYMCKWYNNNIIGNYDRNKTYTLKKYFSILKRLNIHYFLGFGSELGCYRDVGIIKNDHDVDIIIPIWMNYNIFKCNRYIDFKPHKCKIYTYPSYKICNKTRYDFLMMFKDYIEIKLNRKVDYKCRSWGKFGYTSCWMFSEKKIFMDVWVIIGTEYVYSDIKLCKCLFSKSIVNCNENSLEYIIKLYGKKYYLPNTRGTGEVICNIILNPNDNNSVIKSILR